MTPTSAEPVTAWWGTGPAPTERWPGVTIPVDDKGGRYRFDVAKADRVCAFFPRFCSHSKGEFAGQAFTPLDYQTQLILRPIFGWVDKDGYRRFRKAYIEIPKKNGKTQLIAGLALYMLLGDNEPGAEVYVAAADREQARILFNAARSMIESNQALGKRLIVYRNQIVRRDDPTAFFQVLSAEAATKHGPNIHCLIIDELHAQPDRELFETLTRGVIARRQSLILLITTAGDDDESICYEEYDYARRVLSGTIEDERHLPVIFEAKTGPWFERIQSYHSVKRLDILCTCHLRHIANTELEKHAHVVCAPPATNDSFSTETRNTNREQHASELNGRHEIPIECERQARDGERSRQARDTWPSGIEGTSTAFHEKNTNDCATSNPDDAQFVNARSSCASIIATIAARFEAYSVQHAIADSDFWETLRSVYDLHSNTCAVRKNAQISDGVLVIQHPGDDWTDPAVLSRVNPAIGATIKIETLVAAALEATNEPRKRNDFLRYHTNRWTNQATAWIPIEWFDACRVDLDDAELVTLDCAGGLDLAQKWDLAAFVVTFRRYLETPATETVDVLAEEANGDLVKKSIALNYQLCAVPFFWIPENSMRQHEKEDGVPYSRWAELGLVTPTEGDIIDYNRIYTDITTKILPRFPRLKMGPIAYDPAFATDIATKLRDVGGLQVFEVLQNYKMLSEPAQIIEALIKGKRFRHDGHRVYRWNWENVSVKTDDAGRIRPVKPKRATKRVDGAVATIMANKAFEFVQKPKEYQLMVLGGGK